MSTNRNSSSQLQFPLNQNPYQNIGQANVDGFSNNLRYCDVGQVTAEEFNAKLGSSKDTERCVSDPENDKAEEPLFGTHLREAASTVRKLFNR
jgi:hypothetical protein